MLAVSVIRVGVALKSGVSAAVATQVGVGDAVALGDGVSVLVAARVALGVAPGCAVGVTLGNVTTHPDSATTTRRRDG